MYASSYVACRGAAQVCLEVVLDGCMMAQKTFADSTVYMWFQAQDILAASIGREMVWNKCKCQR